MSSDGSDVREQIAKALAEEANSQTFRKSGAAWAGFRSMWFGYADAALKVVEPELERAETTEAALVVTRDRLDALIADGFGATTDTLRELRAALDDAGVAGRA